MELPALDCYGRPLLEALDAGRIGLDVVDTSVRRVLAQKFALGLFDDPFVDEGATVAAFLGRADDVALAAARPSPSRSWCCATTGLLPLADEPASIAVIGPHADDVRLSQGDYHYPTHLEILTLNIEARVDARTAAASSRPVPTSPTPSRRSLRSAPATRLPASMHATGCDVTGDDRSGIAEAVRVAVRGRTVAVGVRRRTLGPPARTRPRGRRRDTADLTLTGAETELVEAVASSGTPTVVVVMSGRVHASARRGCRGAGVAVGVARRQAGRRRDRRRHLGRRGPVGPTPGLPPTANGTGARPLQPPRRRRAIHLVDRLRRRSVVAAVPVRARPDLLVGRVRRVLQTAGGTTDEPTDVTVTVTNAGDRACTEVVQLYVRDDVASVARPDAQLVGFARVELDPGRRCEVVFGVHPSKLAFHDPSMARVCEPGTFTFMAGPSAGQLDATATVELTGEVRVHHQREHRRHHRRRPPPLSDQPGPISTDRRTRIDQHGSTNTERPPRSARSDHGRDHPRRA